jgi:type II secretory pathway pseudopilin PulG
MMEFFRRHRKSIIVMMIFSFVASLVVPSILMMMR